MFLGVTRRSFRSYKQIVWSSQSQEGFRTVCLQIMLLLGGFAPRSKGMIRRSGGTYCLCLQGDRSGGCWSNWEVGYQRSVRVLTHEVHLTHSRDVRCRSYEHVTDRPSCRNQTVHWQSEKRKHQGSSSPTNIPQHRMWTWCNCDEQ